MKILDGSSIIMYILGMATTMARERTANVQVQMSMAHKSMLDRLMAATKPATTQKAFIEYLIEKEAAERGIEVETPRNGDSES